MSDLVGDRDPDEPLVGDEFDDLSRGETEDLDDILEEDDHLEEFDEDDFDDDFDDDFEEEIEDDEFADDFDVDFDEIP